MLQIWLSTPTEVEGTMIAQLRRGSSASGGDDGEGPRYDPLMIHGTIKDASTAVFAAEAIVLNEAMEMMQELIMKVQPDLIIETGIAHGGSIIFSASMLALLDLQESIEKNENYDYLKSKMAKLNLMQ